MPLDPVLVLDTKAWFRKAAIELRSAQADLGATPPILEDVVFHCQQAAEKAIKGFLTYHQEPFGKTHDLPELGKACVRREPTSVTHVPGSSLFQALGQAKRPAPPLPKPKTK
jgi:hypothetical protein